MDDPKLKLIFLGFLEQIRGQQHAILELGEKIEALEMVLRTKDGFDEIYEEARSRVRTPALLQAQALMIRIIDDLRREIEAEPDQPPKAKFQ